MVNIIYSKITEEEIDLKLDAQYPVEKGSSMYRQESYLFSFCCVLSYLQTMFFVEILYNTPFIRVVETAIKQGDARKCFIVAVIFIGLLALALYISKPWIHPLVRKKDALKKKMRKKTGTLFDLQKLLRGDNITYIYAKANECTITVQHADDEKDKGFQTTSVFHLTREQFYNVTRYQDTLDFAWMDKVLEIMLQRLSKKGGKAKQ